MGTIKILHVIGYKNSGKTTLITRWVTLLKEKGYRVAVLKHHGHGAKLGMPDAKKDSMQYLSAGADATLVAGGGFTQHMLHHEASYEELLGLATEQHPDIVLVEGYKAEQGEKVVLVRKEADWETLQKINGISLVVGHKKALPFPQIASRTNVGELDEWLLAWIKCS